MRIFLDTNILLDVFLNRSGKPQSLQVLQACVEAGNEGWIAWHTISNGFYIVRRETKQLSEAKRFTSELLQWCEVSTVGTTAALEAQRMNLSDIEDAMQIAAASACQADVIVTRNTPDFAASSIPVMTPEEFVKQFSAPAPSQP
ncbi:MAG: PIN domain-containing protein [Verrucomicrobiales bacterium]|nr:PIN domain-containing protein [Verrucomicrobiales bacterium]